MNHSELKHIVQGCIALGKKILSQKDFENSFQNYKKALIDTLDSINENTCETNEILFRVNEIRELTLIDKPTFLCKLLLFKFRADYLFDWNRTGKYAYFIDRVNLKLEGILFHLYQETDG